MQSSRFITLFQSGGVRAGLLATIRGYAGTINLPNEIGGLFQDRTGASATTPAALDGDAVGSLKNFGTRGGWRTAAADLERPTLKIVSGKKLLRFDGTSDLLFDADPYLYAAGSAAVFFAMTSGVQAATAYMFAESSTASTVPAYAPGSRLTTGNNFFSIIRDDAGTAAMFASVGGAYSGGPRVVGFVDTGSSIVPYVGKTAGTPVAYTRPGALTANRSTLGGLLNTSAGSWSAIDLYGHIAMGAVPTSQQISDIVDLLTLDAGAA